MRVLYRIRQFWHALTFKPSQYDLKMVREVLSPSLMELFLQMDPSEQAHSLDVFRKLMDQGITHEAVLTAALLHDVGKSRYPLRIWERVMIVLAKALFPAAARSWGQGEPVGWRRPFVVAEQHPEWGAKMVVESGASHLSVAIIRRHQERKAKSTGHATGEVALEEHLLFYLQCADNES